MDRHGNLLWRDQVTNASVRLRKWTSLSAISSKLSVMVGCVRYRSMVYDFMLDRLSVGCVAVVTLLGLEVMSSYSKPDGPIFADMSSLPFRSVVVVSSIVSHLPGALLDVIISIPYYLLSAHKALTRNRESAPAPAPASSPISSSATSRELPPTPAPALVSRPLPSRPLPTPPVAPAPATVAVAKEMVDSEPSSEHEHEHEHEHEASENGSEADVESNDGVGVGESWVSLQPNPTMASSETIRA
jgi:hypothetical protein